jgi:deoxyribose-phosphate aldolase
MLVAELLDEDLIIMRHHALEHIQIKAAGGIRTLERAIEVKKLGCTAFGATATKVISGCFSN